MRKQVRDKSQTEHTNFRCSKEEKALLKAMAKNADVCITNMIQILIWEGAEKRRIHLVDNEVKA
jgi:hypothetical protein